MKRLIDFKENRYVSEKRRGGRVTDRVPSYGRRGTRLEGGYLDTEELCFEVCLILVTGVDLDE